MAQRATVKAAGNEALLGPLLRHEIAGISGLDAAIASEASPGYVVLFQDSKASKQANVEQMATLLRMAGAVPPETATFRQFVEKTQAHLAERVGGTPATLRTLRVAARELVQAYSDTLAPTHGVMRNVLEKARDRTIVQVQTLTAHIAMLTHNDRDAAQLAFPLREYFAHADAKVCFRCHFDRTGGRPALERTGEHPYTYICAGCHDDAVADLRPDLASQMERWTPQAKEARAIQHALGRPSKLMAARTVIRRLSGLPETPPTPRPEKSLAPPLPPPSPSPTAPRGVIRAESPHSGDADYVATLFDPERVAKNW